MNGIRTTATGIFIFLLLYFVGCDRETGGDRAVPSPTDKMNEVVDIAPQDVGRMPDFHGHSVQDGSPVQSEVLRGRIVLVAFFNPWCSLCAVEMALLQKIQNEYDTSVVSIVGMAVVDDRERRGVEKYILRLGLKFPVLISSDALQKGFGGIPVIPTTFLIDIKGNIVKKYVGHFDEEKFLSDIKVLVK